MTSQDQPSIRWDPDELPEGSGDPETDATPSTLLFVAREAWLICAPDLEAFAARSAITRGERAAILFWLAPLERLVRAILFLMAPRALRIRQPVAPAIRELDAAATPPAATRAHPSAQPTGQPSGQPETASLPPRFLYWSSRPPETHILFDFDKPETERLYLDWIARRKARRASAASSSRSEWTSAPLVRRLHALLDVLNDPASHVDRLTSLLQRHRPAFSFTPPRPPRRSGPQAPGSHALRRALTALRADLEAFIGPPEPFRPSG